MAWSLLNHMIADKVNALLDEYKDQYPPEVNRFYSREQAASIIHAVLWGHACRDDSTAGCYAASNLFEAIGLKWWAFDEDDADAARNAVNAKRRAMTAPQPAQSPVSREPNPSIRSSMGGGQQDLVHERASPEVKPIGGERGS